MLEKVLGKTGSPIKDREMMYKAVVQAVLLYRRDIWVVTDAITTFLEGFHRRISRRIFRNDSKEG